MKKYLLLIIFLFATNPAFTQTAPAVEWDHCLGDGGNEEIHDVLLTAEGQLLIAGVSGAAPGDYANGWLMFLDTLGNTLSNHLYGVDEINFQIFSVDETADSGFIFTGTKDDPLKLWVGKTDAAAAIVWDTLLAGGNSYMSKNSIVALQDGFLFAGAFYPPSALPPDIWLIKFNNNGSVAWEKFYGGTGGEVIQKVIETNGGFYVLAQSTSTDGDVSGNHGLRDIWLLKLDINGDLLWSKCLGGSETDNPADLEVLEDGSIVMLGYTNSDDGDVNDNHGDYDFWLVKTDSSGTILWEKNFGGTKDDLASALSIQPDGSFIIGGSSASNNIDVSNHHGSASFADFWVARISTQAELLWERSYGGNDADGMYGMVTLPDGAVVAAGNSSTDTNGDVSENCFNYDGGPLQDGWVMKLYSDCDYVIADFNYVPSSNTIQFNSTSINADQWLWDFGDGTTSTIENPEHTYSLPGTYNVCLTASDSCSLTIACASINIIFTAIEGVSISSKLQLTVSPNPFSDQAVIQFWLDKNTHLKIELVDIRGKKLKTIAERNFSSGNHHLILSEENLPGGIYFLQFSEMNRAGEESSILRFQKLIIE